MREKMSVKRYWIGVISLSLMALLGNWLSVSLFFGVDLIFGSVAVMLAVVWLGIGAAGLVALIGALYTIVLWGQPLSVPGFVIEGLLVAWLYQRRHWKNLVVADLVFWVLIGIPILVFLYTSVLGMAGSAVALIAVKQAVNGVFNALLAGLVLMLVATHRDQRASLSLTWTLFHALLTATLVAGITPILIDARDQRAKHESAVAERLNEITGILAVRLSEDPPAEQRVEYHLGRVQGMFPEYTLAVRSDQGDILAPGHELRTTAPAFSNSQATSQENLNIWLPTGNLSAVVRWRDGYYWLQRQLPGPQPAVIVEYPAAAVVQSMETERTEKFALLSGIFLLAIVLSELISRLLVRPISQFAESGKNIEREVLAGVFTPMPGHIVKEFDQLSSSLNQMGNELASTVRSLRDSRGKLAASIAARTQELSDTNGLLLSVLDAAEDFSIIATDKNGLITLFNAGAQKMLGYSAGDLVGKETPAILHDGHEVQTVGEKLSSVYGTDIRGFRAFVHEAEQGIRQPREWTYITRIGQRIPVRLVVTVIRGADDSITGYLGIAEDISERRRLEQLKNEFVSTVSHELRTPLTSIAGALGLLKSGALGTLSQPANDMVTLAHNNSQRLAGLINDLLDIEKITYGKLHFDYHWVAVSDQLALALASIDQYAQQQRIELGSLNGATDIQIYVDEQRFQQVLANLLSNAIKFSPPAGQVSVDASINANRVRISVRDQGSGIPEEFKERIFQRFAQADSSDQRKKGGTGLGLAISKELVEQMGGNIGFDSSPGQGTVFWLEFPCKQQLPERRKNEPAPASAHQLLVVEDDADAAYVLQLLLEKEGYQVTVAGTAQQALLLCAQQRFAAITLDLGLPDMNGLDLLYELRETQGDDISPVVVVSGRVNQGDLKLLEYHPSIEIIPKPVDANRLLRFLKEHTHSAPGVARILHVEDSRDLHVVIREVAGLAFSFQLAVSVAEARELLRTQTFDLVLLDLGLPDGDGAGLIEDVQRFQPKCGIILLTAQAVGPLLRSRVDATLMKSALSVPDLLLRIENVIKSRG
ncbi:MAG: ATP-binding protein [Pseudohongiella sp.]|nr:ATP-binding protein [Pseudohongiella sp.]